MAQAGSAQREPSMEEILASIRKIIEETEHTREETPAAMPQSQGAGAESGDASASAAEAPAPREADISAFRQAIADIGDDAGAAAQDRPVDDGGSLTLAEVQRRLAREGQAGAEPMSSDAAGSAGDFDFIDDMTPALAADDEPELQEEAMHPAEAGPRAPAADSHAAGDRQASGEAVPRSSASATRPAPAPRPALLSPNVGRQVAGSFDELKEAFMASRQKSFDEMAQEMLRPMLQDWLDNNLPVLVERLVREEIERIARG
ncbi:PopZ family protein [Zhengella sp. ZM62]|uniref:PopZ family protein n=1 Tax=Zhengella sedimenti TaxID=3390035 RepID=UPI003974CBF6